MFERLPQHEFGIRGTIDTLEHIQPAAPHDVAQENTRDTLCSPDAYGSNALLWVCESNALDSACLCVSENTGVARRKLIRAAARRCPKTSTGWFSSVKPRIHVNNVRTARLETEAGDRNARMPARACGQAALADRDG